MDEKSKPAAHPRAWSIAAKIRWGGAALLGVLVIGSLIASVEINEIRMGGPLQREAAQSADLIADILPPPEYVIEPYLEATLLMRNPGSVAAAAKSFERLHRDYSTREAYWTASNLDPELMSLLNDTHTDARKLWTEIESRLLPAARRGDTATMEASYARIAASYTAHRGKIDRMVEAAVEHQESIHASGDSILFRTLAILAALGLVVVALVVASTFALLRAVVRPLAEVTGVTSRLAAGADEPVPHTGRQDELGEIARAVDTFRQAAEDRAAADADATRQQALITGTLGERLDALRSGDLTKFIETGFPAGFEVLRTNFNTAVGALRHMVQGVTESAQSIDTGAREIATATEDLARRTEQNASTLATTRASIDEIDDRLRTSSDQSRDTVKRAEEASVAVTQGRTSASRAVEAMDRVHESAQDIGSVIEGLDKIAFQTRVLSMNATVEAGRAGEAGRGFAVVADLVSALAQRAEAEAARVRDLITVTQEEIVGAVSSVRDTDDALETISVRVGDVRARLEALQEDNIAQSAAVTSVAESTAVMDDAVQRNAAMVEETSAAVRNLSGEIYGLAERAAAFKFERRSRDLPVTVERRRDRRGGSAADRQIQSAEAAMA